MRRIVILGKTGSGKSSVANTLFGEDKFTVCHGSISAEISCEAKTKSLKGMETTLIDTPGFFDTNKPEEALKPEIVKCITECSPGPHAFLIVLKVERFTEQENNIIEQITQYFSEEVFKFAIVVFTHGDDLKEGQKINDFVRPNAVLSELVDKCGGRCHVIDNRYWKNASNKTYRSNAYQVKEILKSVEKIVEENNGNCYTNEFLQAVEEMKQQQEERIDQSSGNMSRKEIGQKAKSRVCDILNEAVGITTGALLGAYFGLVIGVELVKSLGSIMADMRNLLNALGAAATVASLVPRAGAAASTAGIIAEAAAFGTATAAAIGAVFGAHKGYQTAEESETPCEAARKTAQAVLSSGKDAINEVRKFSAEIQRQLPQ